MSAAARCRAGLLGLLLALAAGCGLWPRETLTVAVGSGPEQALLAELTVQSLDAAGLRAQARTDIEGTIAQRRALQLGEADIYWDYTGEVWFGHLGRDLPVADAEALFAKVREHDAANGLAWAGLSGYRQAPALLMEAEVARTRGLATVADLARHVTRTDPHLALCATEEQWAAAWGARGLQRVYGFRFDERALRRVQPGRGYEALLAGECAVVWGHSADPEVVQHGLMALADPEGFLQPSNLAVAVRVELAEQQPAAAAVLAELAASLDQAAYASLRAQALAGERPAALARRHLRDSGLGERLQARR